MDTEKFDSFFVLAETLSFNEASRILHKSQSSLSRQIASLEEDLGIPLFFRDSKSCQLTAAGQYLHQELEKISDEYDKVMNHAWNISQGRSGMLTFGVPHGETIGHYYPLIELFTSRFPDVNIKYTACNVTHASKHLSDGTIDIMLSVSSNPWFASMVRPQFQYIDIGTRHDCLYIPIDHPLADKSAEELKLADFADDVFIVFAPFEVNIGSGPVHKTFAQCGLSPKIRPIDTLANLVLSMENRQGVCIGSNRLVLYQNPLFKSLYLSELGYHREILMWNGENLNPCIESFLSVAKEYLQQKDYSAEKDILIDF